MDRYHVYAIAASLVFLAGWLIHLARTSGIHLADIRRHGRRIARYLVGDGQRLRHHARRGVRRVNPDQELVIRTVCAAGDGERPLPGDGALETRWVRCRTPAANGAL